jgi:hypothetical protein
MNCLAQGQGTRDHRRNSYTYFEDRLAGMNRRNLLIGGGSALALGGAGAFAWRRSTGSMAAYDAYSQVLRAPLGKAADVRDLIRYATLAANGHNTQPWRFAVGERTIRLFPDGRRRTPIVDPDDHHLFVSLGCAAENLVIAARATGRAGEIQIEPGDGSALAFSFGAHEAVADRFSTPSACASRRAACMTGAPFRPPIWPLWSGPRRSPASG